MYVRCWMKRVLLVKSIKEVSQSKQSIRKAVLCFTDFPKNLLF